MSPKNTQLWPPWVNFINVLRAAFVHADPKIVKKNDNLTVFFMLSGSAPVKATRRTLMKLAPYFPCKHVYKKFKHTLYFPEHTIKTRECETSLFAYEIIRRRKKNLYHKNILKKRS